MQVTSKRNEAAMKEAARLIGQGEIVAIKGWGGYY